MGIIALLYQCWTASDQSNYVTVTVSETYLGKLRKTGKHCNPSTINGVLVIIEEIDGYV